MRTTRASFKSPIRDNKLQKITKESNLLAKKLLWEENKTFWTEIKKIIGKYKTTTLPETVEDVSGPAAISEMWRNHFSSILNSSDWMHTQIDAFYNRENLQLQQFTYGKVANTINMLKSSKSPGMDTLQSEQFKYADTKRHVLTSLILNSMPIHSHLLTDIMDTINIAIVSDENGDLSSKYNYRPIAITSVFSKVIELIILNEYDKLTHS